MIFFDRLKGLMTPQKSLGDASQDASQDATENTSQDDSVDAKSDRNIYEELGLIKPFTILAGGQFNSFIAELANNNSKQLNDIEQGAFKVLWNAACIDIDGFGNNIWNLKEGCFEIYNKEGTIVRFEKKKSQVKTKYESLDDGRANFVYLSEDGNFVINQNERNKKIFVVYVSDNMSYRLFSVLRNAEAEALGLKPEIAPAIDGTGIPDTLNIATTLLPKDGNPANQAYITGIDRNPQDNSTGESIESEIDKREDR